jgi:hypothetical protein
MTQHLSVRKTAAKIASTKTNNSVHPSTINKWITRGVKLPDGSNLKLRAVKYPGGWKIREEDIQVFLDAYTAAALGEDPSEPAPATPSAARRRELARVDRDLAARGLGMDDPPAAQ